MNDNNDLTEETLSELMELIKRGEMLQQDAEFSMKLVLEFTEKHSKDFINYDDEAKKKVFKEAKLYLGRLTSSARDQRKLETEYEKLRIKTNMRCGEEIIPKLPEIEHIDDIIKEIFKNDPSGWWNEV